MKTNSTYSWCAMLALCAHVSLAGTYYVEKTGNDSNSGSQGAPWLTVKKAASTAVAGDRILIGAGVYEEAVTTGHAGTPGSRVIYDGQGLATIQRLLITQPFVTIQNLTISGHTNSWFHGLIDIQAGAHYTVVSNCFIKPTIPYLSGIEMDRGKIDPFDDNSPNNCLIVDNRITGVIGREGIDLAGTNNLFQGNSVTNLYMSDFVRLWGRWNIIRRNTFSHSLDYPIGNHVDFVQTFGQNGDGSKGHIIEENWVSDIPNGQIAQLSRSDGISDPLQTMPDEMGDWTFRNNVFAGIAMQASCTIPGTKWYNNVFYRCDYGAGHALVFGEGVRGSADGFRVYNNVFLDCGTPGSDNSGWYTSLRPDGTAWTNAFFDYNFVAKDGFLPVRPQNPPTLFRWYESHGINGGDPAFASIASSDFHLLPASPLIDRGGAIASFNHDLDGGLRPQGTAWDIGPFEFRTATPSVATYYVSVAGNDGNPGTQSAPWRTIQRAADAMVAGDTVAVQPGDYGEYVTTKASGSAGAPITFRAQGAVKTRAFRINNHQYVTIDGFQLTGAQNTWLAHVRIEPSGHHTVVTNCLFGPGVFVIADNFTFNASNNSVSSPSVDFVAAGFVPGGKAFFGGCGLEQYWYNNHDRAQTVSNVTPSQLFLSTPLVAETNSRAWAPIYAGVSSMGYEGISFIVSGGEAASNCTFIGNTFSNLFGCPITLFGNNHVVANNTFTRLNSYYGIRPNGSGHKIYRNFWHDCVNFIQYSADEMLTIPHPAGASWYDYQVGFIHVPVTGVNVDFYENWIENVHNPLGQINEMPGAYGFTVRSNVFVGVAGSLSGGRNGLRFEQNSFYRCGYDWPASAALTVGGNSTSTPSSNVFIYGNAFVDVGSHRSLNIEGFYSLVNVVDSGADRNFVTGPETLGWPAKSAFAEVNGINGGDPLLRDPDHPRGPDGIPFTDDDGLRPLPYSPLAQYAIGALRPVTPTVGTPLAHFTVASISTGFGWYDKVGMDFDPSWQMLAPFHRTEKVRPYKTPEALGYAPVTIEFTASNSISGVSLNSLTWQGISAFRWSFGDGVSESTTEPWARHTYQFAGQYTVSLTVSNTAGNAGQASKVYRVLSESGGGLVTNGTAAAGAVLEWGAISSGASAVVPSLTNCVEVCGNSAWSLALRGDGSLVAWGSNQLGQTNVPPGNVWAHVAAGWRHGIACRRDGTVREWGSPYGGSLSTWEAQRPTISTAVKVAAGDNHSAALLADGTVVIWGGRASVLNKPVLSRVTDIASGWYHMLALQADGTVVSWGEWTAGQDNTVPAEATNVVKVFAGPFTSFALRRDGTVVGWGLNNYGQSTVPAGLRNVVAVGPGRYHTLAITTDGAVHVWGDNGQGQLNIPSGTADAISAGPSFYQVQIVAPQPRTIYRRPAAPSRLQEARP